MYLSPFKYLILFLNVCRLLLDNLLYITFTLLPSASVIYCNGYDINMIYDIELRTIWTRKPVRAYAHYVHSTYYNEHLYIKKITDGKFHKILQMMFLFDVFLKFQLGEVADKIQEKS